MDLRLELVSVPVADVDRAKAFYVDQVGFGVEQDVQVDENHRFVEMMPPGSQCSIA
jgi:catechol 2,3-dioxygenase-like lactoylglutathione lyase family enzyme